MNLGSPVVTPYLAILIFFSAPVYPQNNEYTAMRRVVVTQDFNRATYRKLEELQLTALKAIKKKPKDSRISKQQWRALTESIYSAGGLGTDTPETLGNFYNEIQSRPQPTPYQSPTDYYLLMNRASDIAKMAALANFNLTHRALFGSTLLGQVNAVTTPVENVENEVVVTVDAGLFTFTWLLAKIVAQATGAEIPAADGVTFNTDLERVEKTLRTSSTIPNLFARLVLAYARHGSPAKADKYFLTSDYNLTARELTRSFELFAVGHEFGHIIGNHLDAPSKVRSFRDSEVTQEIWFQQLQEFEADGYGFQLSLLAVEKGGGDLSLAIAGPTLYFLVDNLLCQALGILNSGGYTSFPNNGSHPPPMQRLAFLRLLIEERWGQAAPSALTHSKQVQAIIDLLWDVARPIVEAAYRPDAKPAPVWVESGLAAACSKPGP